MLEIICAGRAASVVGIPKISRYTEFYPKFGIFKKWGKSASIWAKNGPKKGGGGTGNFTKNLAKLEIF